MKKKQEKQIEIIDTYSKEGFWLKRTVDDTPVFIPREFKENPMIQVWPANFGMDVEWIATKKFMSKEEFSKLYPDLKK